MARGDYTLEINSGLPQDITSLTINQFPRNARPQKPSSIEFVTATQYTPAQVPLYTGPLRDRLNWPVSCILGEANYLKLFALFRWQQNRLLNQLDGRLTWTDEVFYMDPEATPTRSLVASLTSADGQTYGFPVVDCLIADLEASIYGNRGENIDYLCTFQIVEVRT